MKSYLKVRFAPAAALVAATLAVLPLAGAAAVPSGEVEFAQARVEPVYNDIDGSFGYLLTPEKGQIAPNGRTTAEIYVVMYPTEVGPLIGRVNCTHQPQDNCPDHGPPLSGLAEMTIPAVYGAGVYGHDHLAALQTAPATNDEAFAIDWIPVVVLFNTTEAAKTHITTLSQLNDARARNLVTEIALPQATFHGSAVAATVYAHGIPVAPAPPIP